jgi:hypothetical protein
VVGANGYTRGTVTHMHCCWDFFGHFFKLEINLSSLNHVSSVDAKRTDAPQQSAQSAGCDSGRATWAQGHAPVPRQSDCHNSKGADLENKFWSGSFLNFFKRRLK